MPRPPTPPRAPHHLYAHRGLPHTFLKNPAGIIEILASPDALEFLLGMWTVVEQELEPSERIGSQGLAVDVFGLDKDAHAAVITMPPPRREFEAFLVALVARLEGDHTFARVFSLVSTTPPQPAPEAAMLEWGAKGEHTFIERRAEPNPGAFVDAIEAELLATAGRAP